MMALRRGVATSEVTPERVERPDSASQADRAADFDQLYQTQYGAVLAMACALTGDPAEAQDLTQEAFCRAWQRWSRVARYDDPLGWIRRIVANLATSRWRRLAIARRHLHRHPPGHLPALEPDHVVLVDALRTLPAQQRLAIVLYHLVDLPVAEVAHELRVSTGTVKSWLSRGRATLAARLSDPTERTEESTDD